jgi:Rieske 2Fe-2S family protein
VPSSVDSPLSPEDADAVLAPLERARPFPGSAYASKAVFEAERARIFARAWTCVARVSEVALPGQYVRAEVAGEGVVVVRGVDLALVAWSDVCLHRGASIVGDAAPCGRASRFVCPYHGWSYELGGRLASAPHVPATFDAKAARAPSVRVDTWAGFVFVTLDADAPPLASALGQLPPWLDDAMTATIATLRLAHRRQDECAANWKLLAENFQESHHFPFVHEELEALTTTRDARTWLSDGPWLGGTMAIGEGAETVSRGGSANGRPRIVPPERARMVSDALLFPALLTSLQPDYLLVYRLVPLAPARTRIFFDVLVHPGAATSGESLSPLVDFWHRVNAEDRAICESQQRNVTSRAFRPSCYATVEEGVHAFDRMVAREYVTWLGAGAKSAPDHSG